MPNRLILALLIVAAALGSDPCAAQGRDSLALPADAVTTQIARLRTLAHERDSLTALADQASGASREFFEELIWQRHMELHAGMLAVADRIKTDQGKGRDVSEALRALKEGAQDEWPRYLSQLQRFDRTMVVLAKESDAASGPQRLAIETQMTAQADRLLQAYQALVDVMLAVERLGLDVSEQRAFLVQGTRTAAEGLVTRIQLAKRDQSSAAARLSRDASNAELRYAFEAADERLKRASNSLSQAIHLMNRVGIENIDLRVALIASTGRITADIFNGKVLLGVIQTLWGRLLDFLAAKAPVWLFQGLVIVLTFIGFRTLSKLVRRVARRAVQYSQTSELMRSTIVRMSANAVMLIGYLVILTQLGVQIAPLLAGLGIAGFVVGFALQNTLSNFAAGGMILGTQPFDIGDDIDVAGVSGVVKRMSLVSTTILTPDNQTLIVPNSTVWSGVIRNRTAQPTRRVDLMFSVDYGDDVEKAERALREVVTAHPNVLKDPQPVIRLHQLADSSVNFVVRAWAAKDRYWDVYWDLTRAVKLRFDEEGITIPFPQRELHFASPPPRNPG